MAYVYYNPNPTGRASVGDCSVRAVAKALNTSWENAFWKIALNAFYMGDVMSSNAVWGAVLREHGFHREGLPNLCPDCYTAEDFCRDNPKGIYVLGFGNHVATVINGTLFDSWNSSLEVPQYFWTK